VQKAWTQPRTRWCGRAAAALTDHPCYGRTMEESSISAVHIERTAHPVPSGNVSADQRHYVVRDRIELSTFRFSGAIEVCLGVARSRLTGNLLAPIVAERRPVSLGVCLRWLPVWLPDPAGGFPSGEVIRLHSYSLADSATRQGLIGGSACVGSGCRGDLAQRAEPSSAGARLASQLSAN
jgi:hypothetical protein